MILIVIRSDQGSLQLLIFVQQKNVLIIYLREHFGHGIRPILSFHASILNNINSIFAEFAVQEKVDEI